MNPTQILRGDEFHDETSGVTNLAERDAELLQAEWRGFWSGLLIALLVVGTVTFTAVAVHFAGRN